MAEPEESQQVPEAKTGGLWCPYISAACREDDCGLWNADYDECALLAATRVSDNSEELTTVCILIANIQKVLEAVALQLGVDATDLQQKGQEP